VLASIDGIFGPPWPTPPSFSPGLPSGASPLDIPFGVTNESRLFSIRHLTIVCAINDIKTSTDDPIDSLEFEVSETANKLGPGDSHPYKCAFNQLVKLPISSRMVGGNIHFETEYDSNVPGRGRISSRSKDFYLETLTSPPQWIEGEPMQ
jgi:hypothetical protein